MKLRYRMAAGTTCAALALTAGLLLAPVAHAAESVSDQAGPGTWGTTARDLGPCWAQAGRVVGGFFGAVGSTIVSPWGSVPIWAGYLGNVAGEKKTPEGVFAC